MSQRSLLGSYIGSGILAIFASWILSGCYFGNRTIGGGQIGTFYYETSPESVQFCATGSGKACAAGSVNDITTDVTYRFTNPIEVYQPEASKTDALFFNPNGNPQNGIGGHKDNNNVDAHGSASPQPVFTWGDQNCTLSLDIQMSGNVAGGPLTTKSNLPLAGRLTLSVTTAYSFSPIACAATFKLAAQCYADVTPYAACGQNNPSDNLNRWQSIDSVFGVWKQLGVMVPSDIPNITALQFTALYN